MLSRVADGLYWMSRYLERAEHSARLVDVELQLWLDQSPDAGAGRWRFLLDALSAGAEKGPVDPTSLVDKLVFSREHPSSIVSCIAAARENLRQGREQCSSEMWEQLNRLYLEIIGKKPEDGWILNSHRFFWMVEEGAHLFQGITDSTMSHGEGWQYIQLGRYVERADTLAAFIGAHFKRLAQPPDQAVEAAAYLEWIGLLRGCGAFEAYCKVYTAEIRGDSSVARGGIFSVEPGFSALPALFGGPHQRGAAHHRRSDRTPRELADSRSRTAAGAAQL